MWECSWWDQFKNNVNVKSHVGAIFPSKEFSLLIRFCKTIFGYVQCNLSVLYRQSSPIFKTIDATTNKNGEHMKTYEKESDLLNQQQRMLTWILNLTRETFFTKFSVFLDLWIQCTKIHRFVQYRIKYSTVSFSLLLMLGEPVKKKHNLVW